MQINDLLSLEDLKEIEQRSFDSPQFIFKHSTRCIISRMALNRVKKSEVPLDFWLLDLLSYREISNRITEQYQVVHQSPQVLVIKSGKAVAFASHENIDAEFLISNV